MTARQPSPEELTQLAEEHLVTLPPGHALIVRVPAWWNWETVKDLHTCLNALAWEIDPACKVIVIPALEVETREPNPPARKGRRRASNQNGTRTLTAARPPRQGA